MFHETYTADAFSIKSLQQEHIPHIAKWIRAIDPSRHTSASSIGTQLSHEFSAARKAGTPEHFVGIYQEQPIFLMTGYYSIVRPKYPGNKGGGQDYIVYLTYNDRLPCSEEFHLTVWIGLLRFLFGRPQIQRVITCPADYNPGLRRVLDRLEFHVLHDFKDSHSSGIHFAVRKSAFHLIFPT